MPVNSADVDSMRNLGSSLADKGFFEFDLLNGSIAWMNTYALAMMGYSLEQAQSMTVFDVVPPEFQESVSNVISDTIAGKNHRYGIWPFRSADGDIVWWYTIREKDDAPLFWYKGELLGKTPKSGPDYAQMCVTMTTVNGYNDLSTRFADHETWTKQEIQSLKDVDERVWKAIEEVKRIGRGAHAAAEKAANYGLQNEKSLKDMNGKIDEGFSKQTMEIMRLISTDAGFEDRFKAFEAGMEKAAQAAVEKATTAIVKQTEKAGNAITTKAEQAGKGLSKKVSIPVGIIATIATIIQLLIQHWPKK
jgi:PAS domain-containing protein